MAARAWTAVAGVLAAGAVLGALAPEGLTLQALQGPLAWQAWRPGEGLRHALRWVTAAWVHLGPLHLVANLLGCGLLAWIGRSAGFGARVGVAWALAWPLTHVALEAVDGLQAYGGLSGVLHAGVACAAVALLAPRGWRHRASADPGSAPVWRMRRRVGLGLALGLAAKLLLERPWLEAVRLDGGLPTVPIAHLLGAASGAACTMALLAVGTMRRCPTAVPTSTPPPPPC